MFVLFTSTVEQGVDEGDGWMMWWPVRLDEVGWHSENQGWSYRGHECHGPYPLVRGADVGIFLDYRFQRR